MKREGLWLAPDGIHHFGIGGPVVFGASGPVVKRRVYWEQITSVVVRLGPWGPPDRPTPPPPSDKPPEVLSMEWVGPTRFDRNFAANYTGWVGVHSPAIRYAVEQLPEAMRRTPALRGALLSGDSAAALLGHLAAAADPEEVDQVLRA